MIDLSIVIPSRSEPYLQKTIEDILEHSKESIEVLVGLDGEQFPFLYLDERVDCIAAPQVVGQRSMTNLLVELSKGKYIFKVDAHCSFSQGFDRTLLEQMDDKTILAPMLLPLYGESWSINGKKQMKQFAFDSNLVMQHVEGEAGETMCLQGSAWMVSKENYYNWNLGDESLGSWGGQGTELGVKAFLNGGRCMTTDKAYYGHVFRHGDSDFPYDRGDNPGKYANEQLKERYLNKSLMPLIEKFGFLCDWRENISKIEGK